MNVRTLIVGTLAIVSGLSAMILVNALRKGSGGPTIERAQVVFATADVKPGEVIQEGMIEIREIPKTDIPEDAITKGSDAIERAAMGPIDKGDMLRQKKLADKGAGRGMNVTIPSGMRAFTITTPTFSSSLAGFILPKNHVDVLLTLNIQGQNENETGGAVTTTLLQNVEVLAVHTAISTPTASKFTPEEARSVTLLVSPDDASLLDLGQNKGTLHLTLRNMKDTSVINSKETKLSDIPGLAARLTPKPPQPAPAPPPPPVIVQAPTPEPLPEFELPEEPVEIKLQVRTLRGTSAGQDTLTMLQKPKPPKRRVVSPGSAPAPASTTPTASGNSAALPGKVGTLAQATPAPRTDNRSGVAGVAGIAGSSN